MSSGDQFATLGDVNRLGQAFCAEHLAPTHVAAVQGYRAFRMRCLATTLQILDACQPPGRSLVSVRLKRLDSIRRKIIRPGTNFGLGSLDDVIGARVICQTVDDVIGLSARIKASPHFDKTKDYIESPAETGYRGIHHIMRFKQRVSAGHSVTVRYELQVRTYLQHMWAARSESHGEKAKIGLADDAVHEALLTSSSAIESWEADNPDHIQHGLLPYTGVRTVVVCWRPPYGPPIPSKFHDNVLAAVSLLNHLEATHPRDRENGLLLVGVANSAEIWRALKTTHPRYAGSRPAEPTLYIPSTAP